jgi:segregation and condensation protein B
MGTPSLAGRAAGKPQVAVEPDDLVEDDDQLPVTPRMIVEGMLFVGRPGGEPLASRDLASRIRDVTTAEVDQIVTQLNDDYRRDEAAYEIVGDAEGYRLQLRPELGGLRQRMRGRVKAARLTPAALEVLAVVAYRQGLAAEDIARLQGTRRQAILAQLVRRQLVRVERPTAPPRKARYYTTDRFNELFGVRSAADLPRNEDLDDS